MCVLLSWLFCVVSGCGRRRGHGAAAQPPAGRPHVARRLEGAPTTTRCEGAFRAGHLIVEVAIEAKDVGVPQVRLDFNLTPQLVLHVALLQLRLEQHLRGAAP